MDSSDGELFAVHPRLRFRRPVTGDEAVGQGVPVCERRVHDGGEPVGEPACETDGEAASESAGEPAGEPAWRVPARPHDDGSVAEG